ncbi:glycoside hydrolase family 2 TIM barrel-domain containing protein [Hoylesella shahii]|uniref:glycoside hydrolase family 2 TIM barrel-domain containing protein n=1 Tax=Hoylesella shahii TaxID=228603 RepID=UPI0028EC2616|nr:glycoside hydrolase family 2 TIM barrel-domain containing protein [Hoylesella shahii]
MGGHAMERQLWDAQWRFALDDSPEMAQLSYDDSAWRVLNLPHDWAIEGNFYVKNPSGAVGGALPGGVGWYRKRLMLTDNNEQSRYVLHFDGAFMNTSVYVNGKLVGIRPYGFIGFGFDITPFLNKKGENVVAVRIDNAQQPNCRWYTGCGIYRHVYLLRSDEVRLAQWGVQVLPVLKGRGANITLNSTIESFATQARKLSLKQMVYDAEGRCVAQSTTPCVAHEGKNTVSQKIKMTNAKLWWPHAPYIYKVVSQLIDGKKVLDRDTTTMGLRNIAFDAKTGFAINGRNTKLNGVCLHGDLGCLGSAINEDALYRQLRMMKDMGANAIRCSHNPPAPELLHMCDTMGLMVMDEAFDQWRTGKTQFDYALFFDKWAEKDITDMVLRDRNHPSIILWSIGNEVLEQWNTDKNQGVDLDDVNILLNNARDPSRLADNKELSDNSKITRWLADIVRRNDPSRLITAGCNETSPNNHLFKSGAIDVIGFNYHSKQVAKVPENFPGKPFLLSESVSALQTRGFYAMPSDSIRRLPGKRRPFIDTSFLCSSYDNSCTSWSATHEATWDVVKHTPFCSGQFIWTGFDYIGEPTPFNFPARSSYFGIVDLAGFPKDAYYLYQSEWTNKTVLHLFPHWNWMPGQTIDLWCYYNNADEVELFVNGQSRGVKRKANEHEYHVMWRERFEPGTVRVVSRKAGRQVAERTVNTAAQPHHLRLTPNRKTLLANGRSLVFITVEVVDKDGNLCPWAENEVFFSLNGHASIAGVDNGSPFSLERFKDNRRKAFFGKCLVVVQAGNDEGEVNLKAKSIGLEDAELKLEIKAK